MTELTGSSIKKSAYKAIFFQALIAVGTALSSLLFFDTASSKSVLKGGLVVVIPNFVFAYIAFRYSANERPELARTMMLIGHQIKLLLTIVLCAVVLIQPQIQPGAFITGFTATLIAQWAVPFFFKH